MKKFHINFLLPLFACIVNIAVINGLNIGVQFTDSAFSTQCSRRCESKYCSVPFFLRYGKYCGILYSGCAEEEPCDGLDACCKVHDACIQRHNNDYLSEECNENFLECISEFRDSKTPTFFGNTCNPSDVVDEISLIIQVALLVGRAHHNP